MKSPPEPKTIQKLMDVYPSFALLAGMQLDLFTPLKAGPMRPEQIASAIGVECSQTQAATLRACGCRVVDRRRRSFCQHRRSEPFPCPRQVILHGRDTSAVCRFVGCSTSNSKIHPHRAAASQARLHTDAPRSVRNVLPRFASGCPHNRTYTGKRLRAFVLSEVVRRWWRLRWSSHRGGKSLPHIQATVVDVSNVTPITQRFVTEAGVSDRVKVITGNVVEAPLDGSFDAVVMKSFIQVLSPNDAQRALKNINATMAPGGTIYILGIGILDNSRISPRGAAITNTIFINIYDEGQAYTEDEYRDWIIAAGFVDFKRDTLPDGLGIITAQKPM